MNQKEVDDWMQWLSERGAKKTLLSVLDEEFCGSVSPADRHAVMKLLLTRKIGVRK